MAKSHGDSKADKDLKPGTQGSSWVTFAQATDSFFSFLSFDCAAQLAES